jgi:tripartite-type tricarboxylate transporter receptor subunit TctC
LAIQAIMRQAKLEMRPVPLEGAGPIVAALLGGHVDAALTSGPSSIGHVRAGKIRYLSLAYPDRTKWTHDVPTMRELGLEPKVFYITRFFFFGPKRIPEEILRFIRNNLGKAYQSEMFRKVCDDNILVPLHNTPEEMRKQFTEDFDSVSEFLKRKN